MIQDGRGNTAAALYEESNYNGSASGRSTSLDIYCKNRRVKCDRSHRDICQNQAQTMRPFFLNFVFVSGATHRKSPTGILVVRMHENSPAVLCGDIFGSVQQEVRPYHPESQRLQCFKKWLLHVDLPLSHILFQYTEVDGIIRRWIG